MSETEQTVGHTAWTIREISSGDDIAFAVECGKSPVADVYDAFCADVPHTEVTRRARLIAAAPRMFDYIAVRAAIGDAEAIEIMESLNANP